MESTVAMAVSVLVQVTAMSGTVSPSALMTAAVSLAVSPRGGASKYSDGGSMVISSVHSV